MAPQNLPAYGEAATPWTVERLVRAVDGALAGGLVGLGALVALTGRLTGRSDPRHGGAYVILGGLMLVYFGVAFLVPYVGMRRRARWRWPAHVVPLVSPFLLHWAFRAAFG
jgi:hypothetical protein